MMAMGMLIREMGNRIRAIRAVDPDVVIKQHNHPLVARVLQGTTTFEEVVQRGITVLEEMRKGTPSYFDLTPEYGEVVMLLGGDVRLCCQNPAPTLSDRLWDIYFLLMIVVFPSLLGYFTGPALFYHGIVTGDMGPLFGGFVFTWIPLVVYRLYHSVNSGTRVER